VEKARPFWQLTNAQLREQFRQTWQHHILFSTFATAVMFALVFGVTNFISDDLWPDTPSKFAFWALFFLGALFVMIWENRQE
jgi:hypothetical protein